MLPLELVALQARNTFSIWRYFSAVGPLFSQVSQTRHSCTSCKCFTLVSSQPNIFQTATKYTLQVTFICYNFWDSLPLFINLICLFRNPAEGHVAARDVKTTSLLLFVNLAEALEGWMASGSTMTRRQVACWSGFSCRSSTYVVHTPQKNWGACIKVVCILVLHNTEMLNRQEISNHPNKKEHQMWSQYEASFLVLLLLYACKKSSLPAY